MRRDVEAETVARGAGVGVYEEGCSMALPQGTLSKPVVEESRVLDVGKRRDESAYMQELVRKCSRNGR